MMVVLARVWKTAAAGVFCTAADTRTLAPGVMCVRNRTHSRAAMQLIERTVLGGWSQQQNAVFEGWGGPTDSSAACTVYG